MAEDNNFTNDSVNDEYKILSSRRGRFDVRQIRMKPREHRPNPTLADYTRGAIMRYFVRKINEPNIKATEVDENQYKMFKNNSFYGTTSVKWMIRGPMYDEVNMAGSFQQYGVYDSNEREARQGDRNLNGVWENLYNYTQFYDESSET